MKSIRKKAKEVFDDPFKREFFESGADYVLEQIEELTNNQNWCAFPKQSHKELKELIEQLKGNQ